VTDEKPTVGELRAKLGALGVRYTSQEVIKAFRFPGKMPSELKAIPRQTALTKEELTTMLTEHEEVAQTVERSLEETEQTERPEPDTPEAASDQEAEGADEPVHPSEDEQRADEAHSTALELREEAVVSAPALLPTVAEFSAMREMAAAVASTQMVPKAYRGKPDDVLAAILTGREMGLGPMRSLRDIFVIDGKPALAAHLLMGQLRKGGVRVIAKEVTDERAWARVERSDTGEVAEFEWTFAEAMNVTTRENQRTIKLAEKSNWRNYRHDMLWARLVGRIARQFGPDLIGEAMPYSSEEVQDWDDGVELVSDEPVEEKRQDHVTTWIAPTTWTELSDRIQEQLGEDEAAAWMEELAEKQYGEASVGDVVRGEEERARDLWGRLSKLLRALEMHPSPDLRFDPTYRRIVQEAVYAEFDGLALLGPPWSTSPAEADSMPQKHEVLGAEPLAPPGMSTASDAP
jgi:hypothetical protein